METLTFRQPRLVALILLVLVSAGFSSLLSIGRQEDPTITNLFATVTTVYPGAEPARVDALVTSEIEEQLREVSEVTLVESTSSTGVSVISIELLETLEPDRIEQVWSEVRDAIDDAKREFPTGVLEPDFNSDGAGAFAAIVALTPAHDDIPLPILGRYADELADTIRNIPGTKLAEIYGQPEEEILVTVDPVAAAALGLTVKDISDQLVNTVRGAVATRYANPAVPGVKKNCRRQDLLTGVEHVWAGRIH